MNDHQVALHADKNFTARVSSLTNLVPNTELSERDVFIIGYPKSGHTWFQTLVAGVIYGVDLHYMPFSVVWDLVPDCNWPYFKRYSTPMFFKSHGFPKPEYKRVVYMVRDGRDVVVSYYHHMEAVRSQRGKKTDFLKIAQGRQGYYAEPTKWHEHVKAWLANPYGAKILMMRYEELRRDTVEQLQRFCEFVGVERDRVMLERVAQQGSFQQMRKKEQREGLSKPLWGRSTPNRAKDKPFMRKGQVGSYKNEMPREVLETFLRDAGDTLRKLGYL